MSKHLVEIDSTLLQRARMAAGTATIRATVEAGLRRLADQREVVEHIRWLRRAPPTDLELLERSRGSRIPVRGK